MLAVNPTLGVNNVAELVALLKKNPGKYNFASIGNGSLSHLAMEAIAIKAGAKLVHIPYPSSPAAITAVIRNDAQMACLPAISVTPQAATGAVKILAVSTAKRSPFPARCADAERVRHRRRSRRLERADRARRHAEADHRGDQQGRGCDPQLPQVREKLAAQLMEPVGNSPEQFRALIDGEIARWAPVIKAADVKVN